MARKLSPIARNAFAFALVARTLLGPTDSRAEGDVKVSTPSPVLRNPYATDAGPTRLPKNDQLSPGKAAVYRNPFAAKTTPPPLDTPFFPGPLSRWQRTETPADETSAVKAAVLAVVPLEQAEIAWPTLPPTNSEREQANSPRVAANPDSPPDPSDFATDPLVQPIWLTSGNEDLQAITPIARAEFVQLFSDQPASSPPSDVLQAITAAAEAEPLITPLPANSPEAYLSEAQNAAQSAESVEDLSGVIKSCQAALDINPANEGAAKLRRIAAWAHNRRGELFAEAGRAEKAIRDFHAAVALDANNSLALHNRAITLAQQEDFSAALSDFDRVIELNPGLAVAYRNRAELLAAHGSMEEAVEDYSRAIDGLPEDAELRLARAHALQRLGESERALSDLDRAIELAPDEPEPFAQRGNFLASQEKFEQAISDFKKAISIDSNLAEAHRSLAWLCATCPDERYRDAEQALAAAAEAVKLSSLNDYLALEVLAAAEASAGRFDEAVTTQQQAINTAPGEFSGPLQQRLSLYEQGQPYRNETE